MVLITFSVVVSITNSTLLTSGWLLWPVTYRRLAALSTTSSRRSWV